MQTQQPQFAPKTESTAITSTSIPAWLKVNAKVRFTHEVYDYSLTGIVKQLKTYNLNDGQTIFGHAEVEYMKTYKSKGQVVGAKQFTYRVHRLDWLFPYSKNYRNAESSEVDKSDLTDWSVAVNNLESSFCSEPVVEFSKNDWVVIDLEKSEYHQQWAYVTSVTQFRIEVNLYFKSKRRVFSLPLPEAAIAFVKYGIDSHATI